jgi:hypothetical protein
MLSAASEPGACLSAALGTDAGHRNPLISHAIGSSAEHATYLPVKRAPLRRGDDSESPTRAATRARNGNDPKRHSFWTALEVSRSTAGIAARQTRPTRPDRGRHETGGRYSALRRPVARRALADLAR